MKYCALYVCSARAPQNGDSKSLPTFTVGIESQNITHPQMGLVAFSNKAGGVKGSNPYFDLKECSAKTRGKTLKQLKAT